MYNLWERIKSGIYEIVNSRSLVVIIRYCVATAILVQRVF